MIQEKASSVLTEETGEALARIARERAGRANRRDRRGNQGSANQRNGERATSNASTTSSQASLPQSIDDFVAYMPGHSYIYIPTREMWPVASVNARVPPVLLVDDDGKAILDDKREPQYLAANAWLDRNRAVEQMTWAPGEPMLIKPIAMIDPLGRGGNALGQ